MLNKKKMFVAASIAGLLASSLSVAMAGSSFPGQDAKKMCGMNGCHGKAACKGGHHGCGSQCCAKGSSDAAPATKVEAGKLTS